MRHRRLVGSALVTDEREWCCFGRIRSATADIRRYSSAPLEMNSLCRAFDVFEQAVKERLTEATLMLSENIKCRVQLENVNGYRQPNKPFIRTLTEMMVHL